MRDWLILAVALLLLIVLLVIGGRLRASRKSQLVACGPDGAIVRELDCVYGVKAK